MRETSFVWVGRATRRWQPKTKGIWRVTALLWDLLNKNTPSLMATKILKNRGVIFNDNDCQLGCQLMSIRETKGIWWVKITTKMYW